MCCCCCRCIGVGDDDADDSGLVEECLWISGGTLSLSDAVASFGEATNVRVLEKGSIFVSNSSSVSIGSSSCTDSAIGDCSSISVWNVMSESSLVVSTSSEVWVCCYFFFCPYCSKRSDAEN